MTALHDSPGDALLRFYRLEGPDARGRTLPEIWAWDAARLEGVHDYIQWLFPLPEPSAFNPQAPILTPETIAAFLADAQLRERLLRSLTLMLDFYGLALESVGNGAPHIEPAPDFAAKSRRLAARRRPQPPAPHAHPDQRAAARPRRSQPGAVSRASPRSRAITRTPCRRRRWTTGSAQRRGGA